MDTQLIFSAADGTYRSERFSRGHYNALMLTGGTDDNDRVSVTMKGDRNKVLIPSITIGKLKAISLATYGVISGVQGASGVENLWRIPLGSLYLGRYELEVGFQADVTMVTAARTLYLVEENKEKAHMYEYTLGSDAFINYKAIHKLFGFQPSAVTDPSTITLEVESVLGNVAGTLEMFINDTQFLENDLPTTVAVLFAAMNKYPEPVQLSCSQDIDLLAIKIITDLSMLNEAKAIRAQEIDRLRIKVEPESRQAIEHVQRGAM